MSRLKAVVVDCAEPAQLARWWARALGYRVRVLADPERHVFCVFEPLVPEPDDDAGHHVS